MSWFWFSFGCWIAVFSAALASPVGGQSTWATVDRLAAESARRSYDPSPPLPEVLRAWDYDDYRLVAFEGARAVWKDSDSPFRLEFFHRGYLFRDEVQIHLLDGERAETVRFDRRLFQYRGPLAHLELPDDVGFAGVRVLGRFAAEKSFQELIVFLGASYFRAVGDDQVYGSSARGLAIDIGLPQPEEFPVFREFWIARAEPGADRFTMWARLDGPSVAGAYQFDWRPGATTRCDVRAKLYFRRGVQKVGIAPLTSMWAWGKGLPGPPADPRPEVHDADGLLIATSTGEWIWRSLGRQSYPSVSRYDLPGVRGFGLLQRDRDPSRYRDDEAKYDRRPSVWIEPRDAWTDGAIELLELPGEHEGIDNIAAWWTPKIAPSREQSLELAYRVSFGKDEPPHELGRAVGLRVARGDDVVRVEVDFAGAATCTTSKSAPLVPEVRAERGRVENVQGEAASDDRYRLRFVVHPDSDQPVELIAVVRREGKSVTETWRYLCRP